MLSPLVLRYREVLQKVQKVSGSPFSSHPVTLIAVSKLQPIDLIEELYNEGHRDFGENYVQELLDKDTELKRRGCSEIRWHFIGHLQKNKVKKLTPVVYCIHTIDSLALAREVGKSWTQLGRSEKLPVFLEVNVDREASKFGLTPEEVRNVATSISASPELSIQGLMCIPSQSENVQSRFAFLRECLRGCGSLTQGFLSMGMSSDFELAIQEGSTHVRIGTTLFGPRNPGT